LLSASDSAKIKYIKFFSKVKEKMFFSKGQVSSLGPDCHCKLARQPFALGADDGGRARLSLRGTSGKITIEIMASGSQRLCLKENNGTLEY